jgi:hypothetical protein
MAMAAGATRSSVRPRRQREGTALRPELLASTLLLTESETPPNTCTADVGACHFYANPQEAERYTKVRETQRADCWRCGALIKSSTPLGSRFAVRCHIIYCTWARTYLSGGQGHKGAARAG